MKALLSGNEAIARGAYEAGVQVVTGYPGTPSSEIVETVAKLYGDEVYAEWSTNEKVAMDAAAGAAYCGKRAMVTTKQVGMNVLMDSMLYAVYTGAEAGLVVITADDPGLFSSQNEQDNRWYSRLAKIPTLEPADSQEAKDFMKLAFRLSEKFDTPVLFRSVMRVSHCKSVVELGEREENQRKLERFPRNLPKYNCTAMYAKEMHRKLEERIQNIAEYAETMDINRIEWGERSLGIITSGVVYAYTKEVFPQASVLKLGMTYPLPERMIREFAAGVEKVLVIEELDPVLEEQISRMGIQVIGKSLFPPCFELLPDRLMDIALANGLLKEDTRKASIMPPALPDRSPVLCAGCPHRSTYYNLAKMDVPAAGDIGCYNLGAQPPFRAQHTMGAMGASIGVLHGMSIAGLPENRVCTIGDSTFFHSGLSPLANMVHNESRGVVILMDNYTTAMTGHQDHPGTDYKILRTNKARKIEIEPLVKAMGVNMVKTVDAFNVKEVEEGLKECLAYDGPSVLITKGACVQIEKKPQKAFSVDPSKCVACHVCLKVGCPSIMLSEEENPRIKKKKCRIDPTLCAGCGVCSQVCPAKAIGRKEN
ncbi:MAG: indolepyruvate ferredoxin oxidoreductase subunit alpha [Clostridia bacterium]|nr:indolepyruvate ferredoxin oxidoreductase subunit alpha [Clostridia bacterium]